MENNNVNRNKKIGLIFGGIFGVLFFILLFMKEKINDTNLVYLFPTTLVIGLFFAALSSGGNVKDSLKYTGFLVGFLATLILIAFLFRA